MADIQLRVLGTFVLALSLSTGCAEAGRTTSAGQSGPASWSLGTPTATIGGREMGGDAQFTSVTQVVPVGERNVFVTDSKTLAVLSFDMAGKALGRIGLAGDGPGEFRAVSNIWTRGDTLFVVDARSRRIQLFSATDGKLIATRPVVGVRRQQNGVTSTQFIVRGFLPSGLFVRFNAVDKPPAGSPVPPRGGSVGFLAIMDTALAVRDTLTWFAQGSSSLTMAVGEYIHFPGPDHFLDTPLWSVAENGAAIVMVERAAAPAGATVAAYRMTRWNENGERVFAVDVPYQPLVIAPQTIDAVVNILADDMRSFYPNIEVPRQFVRDSLHKPVNYPPATEIIFATDGSTWLGREGLVPPPYNARRYDVLDATGRLVARMQLPRPGRLMAATAEAVWVAELDADDVPTVLRYPIIR